MSKNTTGSKKKAKQKAFALSFHVFAFDNADCFEKEKEKILWSA